MPRRSKVLSLPAEVRAELDRRLLVGNFSDYKGLSSWLRGQGHALGHSAIHAYAKAASARLTAAQLKPRDGGQAPDPVVSGHLIECMKIAQAQAPGADLASVQAEAVMLLSWIYATSCRP